MLQIPKIKCNCLNNVSSYVVSFTSTILLTCLFDVSMIKSFDNTNLTVDVTPFFALFDLIFEVGSCSFQCYLAVRRIQIMIKLTIPNILG